MRFVDVIRFKPNLCALIPTKHMNSVEFGTGLTASVYRSRNGACERTSTKLDQFMLINRTVEQVNRLYPIILPAVYTNRSLNYPSESL